MSDPEDVVFDSIELEIIAWIIVAVLSGVGEVLTGSFFLLPFALGAIVAALLAGFGAPLPWVLSSFLVVSVLSLFWLRRFAARSQANSPAIQAGAHRYVNAIGAVTADIAATDAGRVRVDGQSWRALAAENEPIAAGSQVRVVAVKGSALVVEPADR